MYCLQLSYLSVLLFYPYLQLFSFLTLQYIDVWNVKPNHSVLWYKTECLVHLQSCTDVHLLNCFRNISHSSRLFSLQVFNIWLMKNHISGLTEIRFHVLSKDFLPKLESNYRRWFEEHSSWEKKLKSIQLKIYCLFFQSYSCISF